MKIGLVEKVLIGLAVTVVLISFAFSVAAKPEPDSVVVLKTLGMTCGSCAGKIEKALLEKPGVAEVSVDVESAQVIVIYDARVTNSQALAEAVSASGFKSDVARSLSLERYREIIDQNGTNKKPFKKSGCGSGCC